VPRIDTCSWFKHLLLIGHLYQIIPKCVSGKVGVDSRHLCMVEKQNAAKHKRYGHAVNLCFQVMCLPSLK
jgi:hypothetical protein